MSESIGYVLSILIAGIVVFIIFASSIRGNEAAVETLQYSTAKQSVVDVVSMMNRDFRNIGSNYPYPNVLSELAVLQYDTASVPHRFSFVAQTRRGMPPDTVTYRWGPGSAVKIGDSTVSTIELKRFVDGLLSGSSSGAITSFSLELFNDQDQPVMASAETRRIDVELQGISSAGSNGEIKALRWTETFYPMHMSKQDGINLDR